MQRLKVADCCVVLNTADLSSALARADRGYKLAEYLTDMAKPRL